MSVVRPSVAALLVLFAASVAPAAEPTFTKEQVAFFDDKVAPLLKASCMKCHGDKPDKLSGGLDLRTRATAIKGGDTGPAAVPGKAKDSLLVQAVNHAKDGYEMPPGGDKLKPEQIAVLTKWVTDGFAYPADKLGTAVVEGPKKPKFTDAQKAYWAYQPVKRPTVPDKAVHPIDAFLSAKLSAKQLAPSAPAEKATLIRRAYYDLTGLPPTPEEIDAFVTDADPKAWEKLLDKLLASPAYGEKWGRHWLDIVRFAETNGYERDNPKPYAWRYRDYVIKSFNDDKPYDRFVKEQVAGDELPRTDSAEEAVATGFYRLGVWDDEPADPLQARFDGFDDIVTITGQAFLGMTLNCARCHDHKGDPIPQTDYYKLVAFFRDIREFSESRDPRSRFNLIDITPKAKRQVYEKELTARQTKIEDLTKQMVAVEDEAIKTMPAEDQRASEGLDRPLVLKKLPKVFTDAQKKDHARLTREIADLKRKPVPSQEFALGVNLCDTNPPATFVNVRGSAHANGPEVKPGFPEILGLPDPVIPPTGKDSKSSGRRTALANWIASKDNPMTARVMANRLFLHHFGKGIVPTPNDFGKFGELPTNPELLDWLAAELVEPTFLASGGRQPPVDDPKKQGADAPRSPEPAPWTLKRMHKLMMTSAAYQRSSKADAANLKADPQNTLLWRFNARRLGAEEVRDSILTASGKLNPKMGGPSVYPKLPAEVLAGISYPDKKAHWPDSPVEEQNRRSVYVFVKRSLQVPILINHDQADSDNSCPVRYTTTVPTQALGMLNGEFTNEQAFALAARLAKEFPGDVAKQVARGVRLTAGRAPAGDEVAKDVAFIAALKAKHKLDDKKALAQYALLLLNTNEFVYLD